MTLEDRVQRLESFRSIEELIVDLSRAFDGGPSADKLRPLFTDDARFEIDQYGVLDGGDGITNGVVGNAGRGFSWTLHYLVSPKIEMSADGKGADLDFMLWEVATSASGKAYFVGGRYVARAVENGGQWRFAHLRLEADLISHYPTGWVEKPATLSDA